VLLLRWPDIWNRAKGAEKGFTLTHQPDLDNTNDEVFALQKPASHTAARSLTGFVGRD